MIFRLLISTLAVGLYSFCVSSTTTSDTTPNDVQVMENKTDNTIIRAIRYQSGKAIGANVAAEHKDSLIAIAISLLNEAEPMRIHLDEAVMKALKSEATGFEIFFSPPLTVAPDAARLSKMLFLLEGDFSNHDPIPDARFFIALDDNNQYIQSPYVADNKAAMVKLLDGFLK
jgi:hypothetical protein